MMMMGEGEILGQESGNHSESLSFSPLELLRQKLMLLFDGRMMIMWRTLPNNFFLLLLLPPPDPLAQSERWWSKGRWNSSSGMKSNPLSVRKVMLFVIIQIPHIRRVFPVPPTRDGSIQNTHPPTPYSLTHLK